MAKKTETIVTDELKRRLDESLEKLAEFVRDSVVPGKDGEGVDDRPFYTQVRDIITREEGEVTVSDGEYYFFILQSVTCGFVLGFVSAWAYWG